ncbi:hypothetical protein NSK_005531 [Nannochloropsis salina CCMP1776]|jgi:hypothetical protein|uniref:Uncharacterized protein n=1 Tax=Nannochloropsis salina CCMP1776 TaxID=1027361 RepID=A0A4D9CY74_9STRA|nr:hypothetical protein NSK_005531 [Nannochloropsis salina CCMP1776]|eukprot:TFJ83157.1 hypothetical protein NSK_005531 [Nannochloropsis salina CCMP1776]
MLLAKDEAILGTDPALWRIPADLCATTLDYQESYRRRTLQGIGRLPRWGTEREVTIAAVGICAQYRDAGAAFLCEVAEEKEEMAPASPHLTSRVESTGPLFGTTGIVDEESTTEGDPERVQQG